MEWPFSADDLTDEQYEYLINGCSPLMTGWVAGAIKYVMPDAFEPACAEHDVHYWIGHTERDRLASDLFFYGYMRKIASEQSWWKRWWYKFMAYVAYSSVRNVGEDWFYYGERHRTLVDLEEEMANI